MLSGHATAAGTARYRDRFANLRDAGHFRQADHVPGVSQLWLSSIGLGTYLGDPSDAADQSYMAAIEAGLRSGINVLDTAINYRHQRSERNIGAVLKQMIESGELHRDEVLVCTKAGYLSFDGIHRRTRVLTSIASTSRPGFSIRRRWQAECTACLRLILKIKSSARGGTSVLKPLTCFISTIPKRSWRTLPAKFFTSA